MENLDSPWLGPPGGFPVPFITAGGGGGGVGLGVVGRATVAAAAAAAAALIQFCVICEASNIFAYNNHE